MFNDRLHPSASRRGEAEDTLEEMVSLLSGSDSDRGEDRSLSRGEIANPRRSSLESEETVVGSLEQYRTKVMQASPLKTMRLALVDVTACRRRLEKLESDLLHASDSLHFNSADMPRYKRDMSFVNTLTPIITKANIHGGSASRISTELLKALQNYATAVQTQGFSAQIESIRPLVTSLSRHMSMVEETVNEAIAFIERPDVVLDGLRDQMKRMFIIYGSVLFGLFVLFVIVAIRLTTRNVSGAPIFMLIIFFSIPLSLVCFFVIICQLKFKERSLRDELDDWTVRDASLAALKRVQLILVHFSDCQSFKTMVPEIMRTRPSELACTPEEWEDMGKEPQANNSLLHDSKWSRARVEIKSSFSCM